MVDKTKQILKAVRTVDHLIQCKKNKCKECKEDLNILKAELTAISEIVEKDPWISVEDELPKIIKADDGSVNCILIYYDHNAEPGSQYSVVNTAWSNGHIENANKGMFKRWFTWYKYLPPLPEQEG